MCYLFCRFVKPLRGQILSHGVLPSVMTALEPVLMDAARPDASGACGNSSGGGTGGGTGGAMATAGNDDRLYVFEAFGLLLGIEDVPDDVRVRYPDSRATRRRRDG